MARKSAKKANDTQKQSDNTQLQQHHYALIAVLSVIGLVIITAAIALIMASAANKTLDNAEESNNVVPNLQKQR